MEDFPLRGFSFASSSSYTIVEELGRGGMGVVYLVEKNCEGVLDYVVFKSFKTLDDEQEARLRNEANIATFLRHEHIVKTYGLEACRLSGMPAEFQRQLGGGTPTHRPTSDAALPSFHMRRLVGPRKGSRRTPGFTPARMPNPKTGKVQPSLDPKVLFMVMDYVDGADLATLIRHHLKLHILLPPPLSMYVVSCMARALHYAHEWIVHKDVTPGNILISNEGVSKLTDFGIAAPLSAAGEEFAGKVHYMAPEQLARGRVDGRARHIFPGLRRLRVAHRHQPVQATESRIVERERALGQDRPGPPHRAAAPGHEGYPRKRVEYRHGHAGHGRRQALPAHAGGRPGPRETVPLRHGLWPHEQRHGVLPADFRGRVCQRRTG
ncbi:hypothetical protein EDM80_05045 [bacterium]|nr:MAG: hypothetical protein EDM80_05045 [bacterium]